VHQPINRPSAFRVPPLIKRNTALFAISQSFTGAGMQLAYGIGPLMVMAVTHSASLAGLSVALIAFTRFLVAYPVGKITDTYGRKPGIQLGLSLALAGAIVTGLSMIWHNTAALIGGMVVFSMGMNAAQQLRVAATDMFPPYMRAEALGYVALGSLVGLAITPLMLTFSDRYASGIGLDPLGLPWLMLPVLIVSGMIIVTFVRPDPKQIGMNIGDYYPDYVPSQRKPSELRSSFSVAGLLRNNETRLAIASNCAGQGNMSIVMVLTSLVLHHHGHSLTAIAFSHMFHSIGMFAFTIPLGRMADRHGRGIVMYPGVATTIVGAGLVTFTSGLIPVTLGTFLVGVGWAAANVAATAMLADYAETHERGRAIGVADSSAGAVSVAVALATGPLIAWGGLAAAGWTAVIVAAIPLVMLAISRTGDGTAG
jgi:MFS family permease